MYLLTGIILLSRDNCGFCVCLVGLMLAVNAFV